jgi:hypothetical protein
MYRDPLCTEALAVNCRFHNIRKISPAGIPQRGNLVDVHAQLCHASFLCKTTINPADAL